MTISAASRFATRALAKRAIEALCSRLPSRVPRDASLVLSYHNIVPADALGFGDASLHLCRSDFEAQLQVAADEADVVDLPTLVSEIGRPGKRIAITFDDAYVGCLRHGVPLCAAHGIVPTVFVAPGLSGTLPAWDRRAERGEWSPADRARFLSEERGREPSPGVETGATARLRAEYLIASNDELTAAHGAFAFHIGNHTSSHANLASLLPMEVASEVRDAHAALGRFGSSLVPFLAYPYGLAPDTPETTVSPVCRAAFLVEGCWMIGGQCDPFRLPRLNVPAGITRDGFRARLRGWLHRGSP